MALQVWLPLTGDLHNQGLDDITFTQATVAGYEAGKIGQALSLLGTNIAFTASSLEGLTKFSVAFWFKSKTNSSITTSWNNVIAINSSNADESTTTEWRFESSYGKSTSYILSAHNNPGEPIMTGTSGLVPERDKWYHVAATCDGESYIKFYINGEHINSDRSYLGGHLRGLVKIANESADPDALLNDLRIYDHCLSPKEVKEISKGLVVHYPLNDGIGNENLIVNSKALTISCFNQANDSRREYVAVDLGQSYMNIPNGTQVTISFDLKMKLNKVTTSPDKFYLQVYNTNNKCPKAFSSLSTTISTNSLKINLSGDIGTIYKGRVSVTGFIVDRSSFETVTKTNNFLEFYTDYGSNNFYEITNIKMEEGSVATPWIPNSTDALYSELGLDDNIVYDCSGYGHNGTKTSTGISCSSDSPRYSSCMDFETSGYINAGAGGKITDEITISEWVYENTWTADPHPWSCTQGGGWNIQNSNNKPAFSVYVNTVGYVYSTSGDISTPLWTDLSPGWHLFTGTYNGFNVKLYIDGELVANKATGKTDKLPIQYHATNSIFLHREATATGSTGSYPACKMSDMRIYATALSAEDIKSLYETKASIDNYSNIYSYEFMEV